MPALDVHLDGDGVWPDIRARIRDGKVLNGMEGRAKISLAFLPGGMASGKTAVVIRIDLPEQDVTIVCDTSLTLLDGAVRAANARYVE
jgi:hypothetical protein